MPEEQTEYIEETLTLGDVQQVVSDSATVLNEAEEERYASLVDEVRGVGESVSFLSESQQQEEDPAAVTYTVKIDPSQVETAKDAARIVCTEGLLVVILLALLCGLQGWRIMTGGWRG